MKFVNLERAKTLGGKPISEWPSEYQLSDAWFTQLLQICEDADPSGDFIYYLSVIAASRKADGIRATNKELRAASRKAAKSLRTFVEAMTSVAPVLGDDLAFELLRVKRNEEGLEGFFYIDDAQFQVSRLVQHANRIAERIEFLNENFYRSGGGRDPNLTFREIAWEVANHFSRCGEPVTSYDDGKFMRVLALVFEEIDPKVAGESHLRYGREAIKNLEPQKRRRDE